MRLAIVCDDLIQNGGAEKVFLDVLEMYPHATVYSSVISKQWRKRLDSLGVSYVTSFLQKLPFSTLLYRFYSVLYFHVLAFESFNFDKFDVVLSMSSRYAHMIFTKPQTKHVCYMHSIGRMFWETNEYFSSESWKRLLFVINPFLFFVRQTDYVAAQRVDLFLANSKVTKNRIRKYYHRDSVLLNPSVDTARFKNITKDPTLGNFFLVVSRLTAWKKIDIVVKAFEKTGLPLKISGTGPALLKLKSLSKPDSNIEFLGHVSNERRDVLMASCQALIFPQYEDFGIVPLECMASGRPVIAYGSGGVTETVIDGKTGVFFEEQTVDSLVKTLEKFDPNQFILHNCFTQAYKFDRTNFKRKLEKLLNNVYLDSK